MRSGHVVPLGAALLLAACTVPSGSPGPGQASYVGTRGVYSNINPYPDYRYEMHLIADKYASALTWHDRKHIDDDVRNCYEDNGNGAFRGPYALYSIRYCYALDYLAYKDNQVATHHYRLSGNPYFSMDAAARRWETYNRIAQFSTPDAMFEWMRGTYSFTKPMQVSITRSIDDRYRLSRHGEHRTTLFATPKT